MNTVTCITCHRFVAGKHSPDGMGDCPCGAWRKSKHVTMSSPYGLPPWPHSARVCAAWVQSEAKRS